MGKQIAELASLESLAPPRLEGSFLNKCERRHQARWARSCSHEVSLAFLETA